MEIAIQKKTVRKKPVDGEVGMVLCCLCPQFFENENACQTANDTLRQITDNLVSSLWNFVQKQTAFVGVRPILADIYPIVMRSDSRLLALDLVVKAQYKNKLLTEKHFFLYFTDGGQTPLRSRELVGHRTGALVIKGSSATDLVSGKNYNLKEKYMEDTTVSS